MVITSKHLELDQLIRKIERLKLDLVDPAYDPHAWEKATRNFIGDHADELIALLKDLRRRRSANSRESLHRVLVEGYSDESSAEALSAALDKAAHYFSEQHDVSLNLLELVKLPHGGHRALMEIHITPLTLKNRLKHQGLDVELKHLHDRDIRARRKQHEEHVKHLVFDHFAVTAGNLPAEVPDYFLININDAALLNFMIEKSFFKASHNATPPLPTPAKPAQILIRVIKPDLNKEDKS